MSKKKKINNTEKRDEAYKESYTLHTDAINDLVNANVDNSPEIAEGDIDKYKHDWLSKIPVWIKALLIKFWFNGAVCFFFVWGLSMYLEGWDMIIVTGIAMGLVTDLLVNNLFFFFGDERYKAWMMIPIKKFWTIFVNIVYSMIVMILVVFFYQGINTMFQNGDTLAMGVEPITFGIFYLAGDLIFIGFRNLIKKIIDDANKKLDAGA